MTLPFHIQQAANLGLITMDGEKIVDFNEDLIQTIEGSVRMVEKLQPSSIVDNDNTTDQEAIILCRILINTSGVARELWSDFRAAFGVAHGQRLPSVLWSHNAFKAIANEIDLTFLGEKTGTIISKHNLITGYQQLQDSSLCSLSDFSQTICELSSQETMERFGEEASEWNIALDILRQKRVASIYKNILYEAQQFFKTDPKLQKALEYINAQTLECIGLLNGNIGNQGQAVELTDSICGDLGGGKLNWADYIKSAKNQDRPISTGVDAFDLDIDGGVCIPTPNTPRAGRLMVIAARTGVGKTNLGVHVASSLAAGGIKVGFISAELDSRAIEARIIANLSKHFADDEKHWTAVRSNDDYGYVTVGELELPGATNSQNKIAAIVGNVAMKLQTKNTKILVESPWGACVNTCINTMRSMKAKEPELRAIVLDHFHALSRHKGGSASNLSSMLEDRSYMLMTAAKELDIDLFVLAQLNRIGMDSNSNAEPQLNEIRGTDALAHVAHAAWIVRREKSDTTKKSRDLEVWHSKVRGRQSVWKEGAGTLQGIHGFIEMSKIRMHYETASIEGDTTLTQVNENRSKM